MPLEALCFYLAYELKIAPETMKMLVELKKSVFLKNSFHRYSSNSNPIPIRRCKKVYTNAISQAGMN